MISSYHCYTSVKQWQASIIGVAIKHVYNKTINKLVTSISYKIMATNYYNVINYLNIFNITIIKQTNSILIAYINKSSEAKWGNALFNNIGVTKLWKWK